MAETATPPSAVVDRQFTAAMREGELHVMMDVGLAGELGMSVDELKKAIESVAILKSRVSDLEKTLSVEDLKKENEMLKSTVKRLEKKLDDTSVKQENLKNEMESSVKDGNRQIQEQLQQLKFNETEHVSKMEGFEEYLDSLKSKFDDRANEEVEEVDEEEPGIALEDQLRITEQSAKAIDLLSNHLLSTVWQTCSKNTYGFFIRIMLLSGSSFKKQLIPDTYPLVLLGLLGVFFSAAMQIVLAFYLWTRLPSTYPAVNGDNAPLRTYPGTDSGGKISGRGYYDSPLGFARVPLPAYEYPNYKFANDVCRTVPIVQLVTIGLFLFSILNNVPGVLKNSAIIFFSDRFISVDEEGVTKLHYWRESSILRESANGFVDFLYDKFNGLFRDEKVMKKVEMANLEYKHKLINEELDPSNPERLRVRAGILDRQEEDKDEADINLRAFICEMYLSGCVIQDTKDQKRIKEKLEQKMNENYERRRFELAAEISSRKKNAKRNSKDPQNDAQVQHEIKEEVELTLKTFKAEQDERIALHVESQEKEFKAFANAARRRWMLPECFPEIFQKKSWIDRKYSSLSSFFSRFLRCISPCPVRFASPDGNISRGFFEVCEMRSFLAEALRLIDRQNNTKLVGYAKDHVLEKEKLLFQIVRDNCAVWPPPMDIKRWARPIQFCDQTRLNLVRIDYLKPSPLRPHAYYYLKRAESDEDEEEKEALKVTLRLLQQEMREIEDEKDSSMKTVQLKFIKEVRNAIASNKKKQVELQLQEENSDSVVRATANDERRFQDSFKKFEEELNTKVIALRKTADKEKKQLQDSFKKLEDELAAKEVALRKAISSLVYEKKLKKERKSRRSCFKSFCSKIYKCLACVNVDSRKALRANLNERSVVTAMRKLLGRDFADVLSAVSFTRECPSGMGRFRFLAFVFGVLPEVISLLIMAVAGVQYILWSGFKVDSDTQGMEEIILATLAINFIYEIDDAVYDHVFPELYKEAHERDRFDITGFWISSETAAILDKCQGPGSCGCCFPCCFCCCFPSCSSAGVPIEIERDMEEQDSLKKLSRCDPIKWETDSKNHLAQGYFLGVETEELGSAQQEKLEGQASGNMRTVPSACSACLCFVDQFHLSARGTDLLQTANEVPQNGEETLSTVTLKYPDSFLAPGIRQVLLKRGADGKLGFRFKKSKQTPNDPYIIDGIYPKGVLAASSQVHIHDELHAVNGVKVHGFLPDQVTTLVKGAPLTNVRLHVRTPPNSLGLVYTPGLREIFLERGADGKLGFHFKKSKQNSSDPYTIYKIDSKGVLAASSQVHIHDELHAVNGVKVHGFLPGQVTTLVKGAPHTPVCLHVRSPLNISDYKKLDDLEWRHSGDSEYPKRRKLSEFERTKLRHLEVRHKARLTKEEQARMQELEELALSDDERQELTNLKQKLDEYMGLDSLKEAKAIIHDRMQLDLLEELAKYMLNEKDQNRLEQLQLWTSNLSSSELKSLHELKKRSTSLNEQESMRLKELHRQNIGFRSRLENLEMQELQQQKSKLFTAGKNERLSTLSTLIALRQKELTEEEKNELKHLQKRESLRNITELEELMKQALGQKLGATRDKLQQRVKLGSYLSADDEIDLQELQRKVPLKIREKLANIGRILFYARKDKRAELRQQAISKPKLTQEEQKKQEIVNAQEFVKQLEDLRNSLLEALREQASADILSSKLDAEEQQQKLSESSAGNQNESQTKLGLRSLKSDTLTEMADPQQLANSRPKTTKDDQRQLEILQIQVCVQLLEEMSGLLIMDEQAQLEELREQAKSGTGPQKQQLEELLKWAESPRISRLGLDLSLSLEMLECVQQLQELKQAAKAKLDHGRRNVLVKLQQRSILDLTLEEKDELTILKDLARSGEELNEEEKTELEKLKNLAKLVPELNEHENKKLLSRFERLEMEEIDSIIKTMDDEDKVMLKKIIETQMSEIQQQAKSGTKLAAVEEKDLGILKEKNTEEYYTLERPEIVDITDKRLKTEVHLLQQIAASLQKDGAQSLSSLDLRDHKELAKYEIIELEDYEKRFKLELLQKLCTMKLEAQMKEEKYRHSATTKKNKGDNPVNSDNLILAVENISQRLELEMLQQRAKIGRTLTPKDLLRLRGKEGKLDKDEELKGLEKMNEEEEDAIENSTKGMHSAETEKYKLRWSDRFNSTIQSLITHKSPQSWLSFDWSCCNSSDWGPNPFVRAMKMSVSDEWNDMYLAHAYPFLYARKLHYAFANHRWERFLIFYGMLGLHLLVLISLTLIIVGGYRTLANCHLFAPTNSSLGIFATQDWPDTCLLNVGRVADNFTALEGGTADEFLAVSCGVNGYLPSPDEWEKHRNYFTSP